MNTENEQPEAEPISVITVRVPKSLHAELKEFLREFNYDRKPVERWSMNQFCINAIREAMRKVPQEPVTPDAEAADRVVPFQGVKDA